jgi:hypothetical protein
MSTEVVHGSIGICVICGVPTSGTDLCPDHERTVFPPKNRQSA